MQYNTIQYNTIQYNTIQYNTIQYNTIQYHAYKQCVRDFYSHRKTINDIDLPGQTDGNWIYRKCVVVHHTEI